MTTMQFTLPKRTSSSVREPLLTRDDERMLVERIRDGEAARSRATLGHELLGDHERIEAGVRARHRFIEANIGLVVHLVARMNIPPHVDRSDVIQDGMLGLERALDDFDPSRGWKFSTYAAWWVRRFVQQGLENTIASVRIPTHRHFSMRSASDVAAAGPTADAASDTGMAPLDLRARSMLQMRSLDAPLGDDHRSTVGEVLPSAAPGPDLIHEAGVDRDAVERLVAALDPDNAELVRARFGLDGDVPATYASLARERGVTVEAIRRRILRSLARMRPDAEVLVA